MIEFKAVSKTYPGSENPVVNDLSFEVLEGEICVLVGPSGCGKTTSMRMVNRLIEITEGEILIDGEPNTAMSGTQLRRKIGYAIQQIGLFPHRTIADNIGTVPNLLGWDKSRIKSRVDELLDTVGLAPDDYRDRYPAELSGGQQQRVGVARALAADPPIMLMDEPFGAVDPITREGLQDEFLRIQQDIKKTIVFVTHDIDEAIKMGNKIAILKQGGVLAQYDTPENILASPTPSSSPRSWAETGSSSGSRSRASARWTSSRPTAAPTDLLRINEGLSVKDALSELIGSGYSRAVVEKDGDNRLLTFDAIEELMGGTSGEPSNGGESLRVSGPALLLLQDVLGEPKIHRLGVAQGELLGGYSAGLPGAHLPLFHLRRGGPGSSRSPSEYSRPATARSTRRSPSLPAYCTPYRASRSSPS